MVSDRKKFSSRTLKFHKSGDTADGQLPASLQTSCHANRVRQASRLHLALFESDRAPSVGEGFSMCWLLDDCFAMPAYLRRGDLAGVNQPGRRLAPSLESNDASAVPHWCDGVGRCTETHARVPAREQHSVWDSSAQSLPVRAPGGELRVAARSRCIFRTEVVILYLWQFA